MPKTKQAPKSKPSSKQKLPTLEGLSLEARKAGDGVDDQEEEQEFLELPTPKNGSTVRKVKASNAGNGFSELVPRKNLRELFSAEETIIETITLDGKNKQETKPESMMIFLRVRPFLPVEVQKKENKNCFFVLPQRKGIVFNPPVESYSYRRLANSQDGKVGYEFTQVLGDELSQQDVFDATMRKPIQKFLMGTSQLLFTYGVTNSGKTYTLLGPRGNAGLLPRSLERIFSALGDKISKEARHEPCRYEDVFQLDSQSQKEALAKREMFLQQKAPKAPKPLETSSSSASSSRGTDASQSTVDSHGFFDYRPDSEVATENIPEDQDCVDEYASYEVWVSFIEVYEDMAYDLLDLQAGSSGSSSSGRVLRSRTLKICDEQNTCYAKGLVEVPVFSAAEAYHVMGLGRKNLHVAATKLNEASSRSHSIFTVKLIKLMGKGKEAIVTQLAFCDLAGTERANRTDNSGTRLKESQNINKDLHHLKECIEALRKVTTTTKQSRKKEMVPYRNCKLTRLFRSFFSGKGTASMIVNISQCASDFDETVQAIRFGSSAMRIMIPMTKRESVLIQPPHFSRRACEVSVQNVVSVQLDESMESVIYESDEDNLSDSGEKSVPSTVKKQPLPRNRTATKTTLVKGKKSGSGAVDKKKKPETVSTAESSNAIRAGKQKISNVTVILSTNQDDEMSEDGSMSGNTTDTDSNQPSGSGCSAYGEEEDEDLDIPEVDLTVGGAVRGDLFIDNEFWEENNPYPEHEHEQDQRIRGLLLLMGQLQNQIKQTKALNMTNEMKVRKELCDFYDKERQKYTKEHAQVLKKREEQHEADIARQVELTQLAMERKFDARGDPSLLSFENHEMDENAKELAEENAKLLAKLESNKQKIHSLEKKLADYERNEESGNEENDSTA